MSVKNELIKWLRSNVSTAKSRVFSNRLRQQEKVPAIVVDTEAASRTHTIDGLADATKETTFSLDCIADEWIQSEQLADEVENLDGTLTDMGDYNVHFRIDSRSDDWFDNQAGQDKGRYITTVDVILYFTRN